MAGFGSSLSRTYRTVLQAFIAAVGRMDKSLTPSDTIARLRKHTFTASDSVYAFYILLATFWLTLMQVPSFPSKLAIPVLYTIALLVPFTSQFFLPATPVFAWLLTFYSSRFIPTQYRPTISVTLLPTLESALYGANISDLLTRTTHPILDIIAWLPYGLIHFTFPFVVAAFLWLFRPKDALHTWAFTFGWLNIIGVVIQIVFPCAAPWYELIYGLIPADYSMKGDPGGLGRIDKLFNGNGYRVTFSNAPVVFGAFPSLHAGCATIEALFISHFFPQATRYVWTYTAVLYWATMYLTHHYLIDVVAGAGLAVACFYFFLPDSLRGPRATSAPRSVRNKYDLYDLDIPRSQTAGGHNRNGSASARGMMASAAADFDLSDDELEQSDGEEVDIAANYRSPVPGQSFSSFNNTNASSSTNALNSKVDAGPPRKSHKHTASIASLIRGEERGAEEGWSPIRSGFSSIAPGSARGPQPNGDRQV